MKHSTSQRYWYAITRSNGLGAATQLDVMAVEFLRRIHIKVEGPFATRAEARKHICGNGYYQRMFDITDVALRTVALCEHAWQVFGTCDNDDSLLVRCDKCSAYGTVYASSEQKVQVAIRGC